MTLDDIDIMASEEFRLAVEANLRRDPAAVALDKGVSNAALVASQVKYLRRAEGKLPSYFDARCILPAIAFEQSSSEAAAARKEYSGRLCIDLTCGLGVDSYWLSRRFDRVVALERDPVLAAVARANFARLGTSNIEVVETSAEEFVALHPDLRADMVYADPDRRGSRGEKLVRLEDCSPDMVALYPALAAIAPKIVIKCSPMFDVDEAFRLFGDGVRVEVVSLGGENKEVVVEISDDAGLPAVAAVAIGCGSVSYPFRRPQVPPSHISMDVLADARWLILPDAALQKARLAVDYYIGCGCLISDNNGFAYFCGDELPGGMMGRAARIERVERFVPKALKTALKSAGVRRADILKRNFPMEVSAIARQLGVAQGGADTLAFTVEDGRKIALFIRF